MTTWVFGYGSLVWKAGFEHTEKKEGYVRDYARVWHQGSTDHRGTPEKPGRTVTIEPRKGAKAWGVAYKLPKAKATEILEYLEVREKQYDLRVRLPVYTHDDAEVPAVEDALVYIATDQSPNYLGYSPLESLALQMATARGPSGENCEYVYKLAEASLALGMDDEELVTVAKRVREIRVEMGLEVP